MFKDGKDQGRTERSRSTDQLKCHRNILIIFIATHTYLHAHIHIYVHTHLDAYKHIHIHTYTHISTFTH